MSESAHRAARQGVHSAAAIEEAESLMTAGVEAAATACAGGDQPQDVPDPAPSKTGSWHPRLLQRPRDSVRPTRGTIGAWVACSDDGVNGADQGKRAVSERDLG